MADETRVSPFWCGTQYADWQARNCDGCRKFDIETPFIESRCEIDQALGDSMFGDGTVSAEIGSRMGWPGVAAFSWVCPEREEESESARAAEYRSAVEAAGQLSLDVAPGRAA
jgi:hypothetical protein